MDFHSQQQRTWVPRAIANLRRVRSPDALLALILEFESCIADDQRAILYSLVIEHGRHFDARVISILCEEPILISTLVERVPLSLDAAEWLAVWLVAGVRAPSHVGEFHVFARRTNAFSGLVRRYRLSAKGLAGQILYNEAAIGPGPLSVFASNALMRLLMFADVPHEWIRKLTRRWQEDSRVVRLLTAYQGGGTVHP